MQEAIGYAISIQWYTNDGKEFFEYTFPCPPSTGYCYIYIHTLADLIYCEKLDDKIRKFERDFSNSKKDSAEREQIKNAYFERLNDFYDNFASKRDDTTFY